MRGENISEVIQLLRTTGTSPRARGKLPRSAAPPLGMRNIPACAGKTLLNTQKCWFSPEHPRVRGENVSSHGGVVLATGTSPRARGKHLFAVEIGVSDRNIPACAGKTSLFPLPNPCCWEHPRVRGENARQQQLGSVSAGTSPRARGKQSLRGQQPDYGRNIPACAGKT